MSEQKINTCSWQNMQMFANALKCLSDDLVIDVSADSTDKEVTDPSLDGDNVVVCFHAKHGSKDVEIQEAFAEVLQKVGILELSDEVFTGPHGVYFVVRPTEDQVEQTRRYMDNVMNKLAGLMVKKCTVIDFVDQTSGKQSQALKFDNYWSMIVAIVDVKKQVDIAHTLIPSMKEQDGVDFFCPYDDIPFMKAVHKAVKNIAAEKKASHQPRNRRSSSSGSSGSLRVESKRRKTSGYFI